MTKTIRKTTTWTRHTADGAEVPLKRSDLGLTRHGRTHYSGDDMQRLLAWRADLEEQTGIRSLAEIERASLSILRSQGGNAGWRSSPRILASGLRPGAPCASCHERGHPRNQREQGRGLLATAEGRDIYEKTAWIKGQREAMRLLREMGTLISRDFVAQRLAAIGRMVADRLDQVPDRLAPELAMRTADHIRSRLRTEISGACAALASGLELGQESAAVDVKREQRKGHRGVKHARPGEIASSS